MSSTGLPATVVALAAALAACLPASADGADGVRSCGATAVAQSSAPDIYFMFGLAALVLVSVGAGAALAMMILGTPGARPQEWQGRDEGPRPEMRNVAAQSPMTFKRDWARPRMHALPENQHGAWHQ